MEQPVKRNNSHIINKIFFLLVLLLPVLNFAQQIIKGKVVDSKTNEPLLGVSIYIDGTSLGTVTNLRGVFEFKYPKDVNSPLIFSMLGYEKVIVSNPLKKDLTTVSLVEKPDELKAVVIETRVWSREKKEKYFKKYFLGSTELAQECKIKNLDKVKLIFNPKTSLLTASCDEPIMILNKYLGYLIHYDLTTFELSFSRHELNGTIIIDGEEIDNVFYKVEESYYLGSSYFEEITDRKSQLKKYKRRRKRLYKTSELRFYRSIISRSLKENGYYLVFNKFSVPISNHLRVHSMSGYTRAVFREGRYSLLDPKKNQTDLILSGEPLFIYPYGNNINGKAIKYSGYLAELRVSGMLPLDYKAD